MKEHNGQISMLIFKRSKELDDLSILDKYNNIDEISLPLKSEGVIIKLFDSVSGKSYLLKIQNNTYQFLSMIKPNEHKLVINFVHLYKTDIHPQSVSPN